jgi:recombination protein RecA
VGLKVPDGVELPTPEQMQSIANQPVVLVKPQEDEGLTAKELAERRSRAAELTAQALIDNKNKKPLKGVKVGTTLAQIMAATEKKKGQGIFMQGKDVPNAKRIPTGVFELDLQLGGGFPMGRYSQIIGPESGCKTTIALLAAAQAQKLPAPCNKVVFIDAEHAFDPKWAAKLGVDVEALVVVKPGYGEEAGDIFEAVVRAEDVAMVIFDSIACIVSTKESEQSLESFDVGTAAILVKRMVNKGIMALAEEAKSLHFPALVFINQIRYKIGVMFGNPETTPGGKAKDFASSLTIRVSATNKIVKEVNPDIHSFKSITCRVVKSKVPVVQAVKEFDLCVYEHDGLNCGETRSWNTVCNALKQMGALTKAKGGGWSLLGHTYPTQDTIQSQYEGDNSFMLELQRLVIDSMKNDYMLIGNPETPTVSPSFMQAIHQQHGDQS